MCTKRHWLGEIHTEHWCQSDYITHVISLFCDGCSVMISGVVCLLEICNMMRVWVLCHFFCFDASPRCHVGVLHDYWRKGTSKLKLVEPVSVTPKYTCLSPLPAYQPRDRVMWFNSSPVSFSPTSTWRKIPALHLIRWPWCGHVISWAHLMESCQLVKTVELFKVSLPVPEPQMDSQVPSSKKQSICFLPLGGIS